MILESLFGMKMSGTPDVLDSFWYGSAWLGRRTTSGVTVSEETAFNYSVVWAATRLLSGTAAWLPCNFFRRIDEASRTQDESQPGRRLLVQRPNPEMTAFAFRSLLMNWQINWGNGYAELVYGYDESGVRVPMALYPIHPSKVTPVWDEGDRLYYRVRLKNGEYMDFPPEDIFHVPNTITADGVCGRGVIAAARETIGGGLGAEREANSAFGSGHMPRIIIETPKIPNETERSAFRKEWKEIHSDGGDSVALITGGATAKPLSLNHVDMQFLESRQFTVEEMARWYGVPAYLIGQLSGIKYNSAEMVGIDFVTYSFIQLLAIWEQETWFKLISPEDQPDRFVKFNFNGLMRGDSAARASYYTTMINNGIMTFNEVRALEDLNPVDGGDFRVIQGAMATINPDGTTNAPAGSKNTGSEQPVVDDDAKQTVQAMRVAARTLLHGSLNRMVSREAYAARKASKRPKEFMAWLDEFYAGHEPVLKDAIQPTLMACETFGMKYEPARWANALCIQSKTRLLDLSGEVTADDLPGAVDALMADWERSRAEDIVAGIAELN